MQSYKFFVSGHVQGVFYRVNVSKNAQIKGFSGYVKNLGDGRVEAAVSCEEERLQDFIALLQKGSARSRVESIDQIAIEESFSGVFVVR